MKNSNMFFKNIIKATLFTISGLSLIQASFAQDVAEGAALFQKNCKSCHAIERKMVGPALKGISERHDEKWLLTWIKNAPAMIATGDPAAVKLFNDNNKMMMPPQPMLTEGNILSILAYVKSEEAKTAAPSVPAASGDGTATAAASGDSSGVSDFMLIGLFIIIVIAFLIIGVLNRIIGTLERMLAKRRGSSDNGSESNQNTH
jgi:cytochrome c551/c552